MACQCFVAGCANCFPPSCQCFLPTCLVCSAPDHNYNDDSIFFGRGAAMTQKDRQFVAFVDKQSGS